jgi:hypothetical protein
VALELINNFAAADLVILNAFCVQYYMGLVQDIFFVLTDTDHKSSEWRMIDNYFVSSNILHVCQALRRKQMFYRGCSN